MRLILLLLCASLLSGQSSSIPTATGSGGGGTIATQSQAEAGTSNTVYSSPLKVAQWARRCSVQNTSTVLTVAAGASATVPCIYRIGNVTYSLTAAQTLTITAGSGNGTYYVYVSALGAVTVQYSSGASLTVTASGLTGSAVVTPGWPTNGHIPLGSGSITTGAWGTPTPAEAEYSVFAAGSSTTINAVQAGTGEYTFEAAATLTTDDEFIANTPRYAATMGGTTSALTLSTGSSYSSPNANGVCVMGKNTVGNSTTSGGWTTLAVNSATAKKLYKPQGTSDHTLIIDGDLRNNSNYEFCHNTSLDSGAGGWVVNTGTSAPTTPSAPAGTWMACSLGTCYENAEGGNGSYTANTAFYFPITIPVEVVGFNFFVFYVNTSASAYLAMALYDSSCNLVTNTTGNVSVGTGGVKKITTASTVTLSPGQYFIGFAVESATAGIIAYDAPYSGYRNQGSANTFFTGSNAPSGSGATFAMPSSCGTKSASSGSTSGNLWPEFILFN